MIDDGSYSCIFLSDGGPFVVMFAMSLHLNQCGVVIDSGTIPLVVLFDVLST